MRLHLIFMAISIAVSTLANAKTNNLDFKRSEMTNRLTIVIQSRVQRDLIEAEVQTLTEAVDAAVKASESASADPSDPKKVRRIYACGGVKLSVVIGGVDFFNCIGVENLNVIEVYTSADKFDHGSTGFVSETKGIQVEAGVSVSAGLLIHSYDEPTEKYDNIDIHGLYAKDYSSIGGFSIGAAYGFVGGRFGYYSRKKQRIDAEHKESITILAYQAGFLAAVSATQLFIQ